MLRRGYVETQIEALAKALASILLRRNEGDYNGAITEIRLAGQKMTGMDPTALAALADEALVDLFMFNKQFDAAKCYMAGRLLEEQAEVFAAQGKDDSAHKSIQKAHVLLMEALTHNGLLRTEENIALIDVLASKRQNDWEAHSRSRRLFHYFDAIGNYARAEDALFEFKTADDPEWQSDAEEFYERLLSLPDDALARGRLPRDEVVAGLEEIRED